MNRVKNAMWPDDTQDEIKDKAETVIENAQKWFTANSLKINPAKSEVMVFSGLRQSQEDLYIPVQDGNVRKFIKTSNSMKILGVVVDNKLTWAKHISKVKQLTHRTIANLARTTHVLSLKSRRTLYDALVAPHFNYCDIVWDGASTTNSKALQKTGNYAARALLGWKKRSSATEALHQLNMMPLANKRTVHLGVFAHKIMQSNGPRDLTERYKKMFTKTHGHHTRQAARQDMKTLTRRTARFDSSTQCRAAQCWNSIPTDIRSIADTSSFKKRFQNFLLCKYKSDNECIQASRK